MQKLYLLATTIITLLGNNLCAQNTLQKWYLGVGANVTDHTSVRGVFDGFFDTNDYDFYSPVSKFIVARSVAKNLAVDFQVSILDKLDNKRLGIKKEFFVLMGVGLRYSPMSESRTWKWLDPYLRIGGNYHQYSYEGIKIDENHPRVAYDNDYNPDKDYILRGKFDGKDDMFVVNGGVGFNIWFTKVFGVNIESQYNWATNYSKDYADFFQHSLALVLRLGGGIKDRDGDGIPDKDDRCPDIPGPAIYQGCPDTDGDGIPDPDDACPYEPGPHENSGCPWSDRDGDGIPDKDDRCPDEPGPLSNNGCPIEPKIIENELKDVNFKFDSYEITSDSQTKINNAVDLFKESNLLENGVYVDGHSDRIGSAEYNMKLSQKRAHSVVEALIKGGINRTKLTPRGFGKSQLKCTDSDVNNKRDENGNILYPTQKDCDQANRRVEIIPKN